MDSSEQSIESSQEIKPSPKIKGILASYPVLAFRTPFERSEFSCIENIVRGTAKSFGLAVVIKVAFSFLPILFSPNKYLKNPRLILEKIVSASHLKSGVFAGSMTFVFKTVIVLARILRNKDDGWNGFAAGFLAGFVSMFFLSKRRGFLATLLLARGVECIYNHCVKRGYFKKSKLHWVMIYNIFMMFIFYACYCERHLLPPGSESGFDSVATQPPNELFMLRIYHEIRRRDLVAMNTITADPYLVTG